MYRLLVVDDEEWIREGLSKAIEWRKYGIELCGTASGAKEAMDMIPLAHPDVIVTDIVMSEYTGIDLCGWVQELSYDIKLIILSGYDEFAYAREAMQKGAFDYLLKPVEESLLVETVQRAGKTLETERKRFQKASCYEINLEHLKELFYLKLLNQKGRKLELLGNEMEYLEIPVAGEWNYACAIYQFKESEIKISDSFGKRLKDQAKKYIEEIKTDTYVLGNQILFLAAGRVNMQEILFSFFEFLYSERKIPAGGCCISHNCISIYDLKKMVIEAVTVLNNQFQIQGVRCVQELERNQKGHLKDCSEAIEKFLSKIDISDRKEAKKLAEQLIEDIFRYLPEIGKTQMGSVLFQTMARTAEKFQKEGSPLQMSVTEKNEAVSWVFHLKTPHQTIEGMKYFLDYLYDNVSFQIPTYRSRLIQTALDYIDENFKEDISAEEMAVFLNISKVYFSQIFSKEMGTTFIKYLTNYRIEHAKELLIHTNNRIYEIAEESGYPDVKYFLKVFKKVTGQSPQSYRVSNEHKN